MKNHGGAVQDSAETLSEVPILCDHNSPNLILELELELKTGNQLFATATAALTSLPTIFKFSFNRGGHNLSCG